MKATVWGMAAGCLMSGLAARAAEGVRAFGLEFTIISNAVIVTNAAYDIVRVLQVGGTPCEVLDTFPSGGSNDFTAPYGISVHLGEAQSGVYVSPGDAGCRMDGRSMTAHAYGKVSGNTNQPISFMKGTRIEWGYYRVDVDFSPLGATSYTYQVWSHGVRTLHATNRSAVSHISTINVEDYNPRVNPVFLSEAGTAAIIEFPNGTYFSAGESSGVGDRFMIIAEGVTNSVEHLSRVDIFGSANLPAFDVGDARIGMFGRPHKAMGGVVWLATNGTLKAGPFVAGQNDGVLVDFKNGAMRWVAQTEPFRLEEPDALLHLSSSGLSSGGNLSQRFLGPAGFVKSNGVVHLQSDFWDFGASNALLRVFQSNVLEGTIYAPSGAMLGMLAETNPLVTGWAVTVSNLSFTIAEPSDLTAHDGARFRGDRFEFAPHDSQFRFVHVNSAHLLAQGLRELTIVSEVTEEAQSPPIRLEIERAAPGLVISWPYHPDFLYLDARTNVAGDVSQNFYPHYRNLRWYVPLPATNAMKFFSLRHNYEFYIRP